MPCAGCESKRLTQTEVANRLDVTQSWVSKLESANYDHQIESVLAYLDALGADLGLSILTETETIPVEYEAPVGTLESSRSQE